MQPSVRRRTFVSIAAALGLTGGASHRTGAVDFQQSAVQERWNQVFSEDPSSFRGVARSSDGYVAAGRLGTEGWIVQFDDEGRVQWDTATGVEGANAGFEDVVETPGGFVAAGLAEGDQRNAWLVAVDGSGGSRWEQLVTDRPGAFRSLAYLDGTILAVGETIDGNNGWVVAFDTKGQRQWAEEYGPSGTNRFNTAFADSGAAVVGGSVQESSGSSASPWLLWIDPQDGSVLDVPQIQGEGQTAIRGIERSGGGDLVAVGSANGGTAGFLTRLSDRSTVSETVDSGVSTLRAVFDDGEDTFVGGRSPEDQGIVAPLADDDTVARGFVDDQSSTVAAIGAIGGLTAVGERSPEDGGGIDTEATGTAAANSPKAWAVGLERVENPVVASFEVTTEDPTPGQSVSFDASGSSPTGDIDQFEWSFTADSEFEALGAQSDHVYEEPGEYEVSLRVTTTDGSQDQLTRTIQVLDGLTAAFSVATSPPVANQPVTFDASESTPSDGIETYEWAFELGDEFEALGAQPEHVYEEPGEYEVRLRVRDGNDTVDTTSQTITVGADGELTAAFSIENDVIVIGEEIQFDATASQPESIIDTYEWDFTGDSQYVKEGVQPTYTYEETADLLTVRLRVVTAAGKTAQTEQQIEVVEDGTLDAAFFISPNPQEAGKWIQFDAGPSSPKRIIDSYEWEFPDGTTEQGGFTWKSYEDPGEYQMTLTIADGNGNTDETTRTFEIIESLNLVPSIEIDPMEPQVGETVTFDASGTEAELGVDSYRWDFDFDGEFDADAEGETVTHTFEDKGAFSVVLEVIDNGENSAREASEVAVGDPGLKASFEVDPAEPVAGQSIQFDASGSVPENSIETYEWQFKADSFGSETGRVVTHEYTEQGDYEVTLTVTDGEGETAETTETISVGALELDPQFTVDPSTPQTGKEVQFDASESKPAEQIDSYEWEFNSGNLSGETGTGEVVTHTYDQPGEYDVALTVSNGEDQTQQTTETITVEGGNVTARFDVEPEAPTVGETVTVDASSSEADDEIERYEWGHSQDFGVVGEGVENTFTFDSPGEVDIRLVVKTATELQDETTQTITVEEGSEDENGNGEDGEDGEDDDGGFGSPGDDDGDGNESVGDGDGEDEDLFPDDEDEEEEDFFDDNEDGGESETEEEGPQREPGEPPEDVRMPDRLPLGAAATLLGGGFATRVYRRLSDDDSDE